MRMAATASLHKGILGGNSLRRTNSEYNASTIRCFEPGGDHVEHDYAEPGPP